jgi:hypothetical protein
LVIVSGAELGIPWVVVGTKADKLVASDAEVATVVAARGGVVDTGVVRDELTRRKRESVLNSLRRITVVDNCFLVENYQPKLGTMRITRKSVGFLYIQLGLWLWPIIRACICMICRVVVEERLVDVLWQLRVLMEEGGLRKSLARGGAPLPRPTLSTSFRLSDRSPLPLASTLNRFVTGGNQWKAVVLGIRNSGKSSFVSSWYRMMTNSQDEKLYQVCATGSHSTEDGIDTNNLTQALSMPGDARANNWMFRLVDVFHSWPSLGPIDPGASRGISRILRGVPLGTTRAEATAEEEIALVPENAPKAAIIVVDGVKYAGEEEGGEYVVAVRSLANVVNSCTPALQFCVLILSLVRIKLLRLSGESYQVTRGSYRG